MNRSDYYEKMKELAHEVRTKYQLATPRVMKSDMRKIYQNEGIEIDLWPLKDKNPLFRNFKNLRGAYFHDEFGTTVLLARSLPQDPAIFTMAHELKHHLIDHEMQGFIFCDLSNENEVIEISAEVFAAELIYPEQDFANKMHNIGIEYGQCQPADIVRIKRETETTLSYTGLAKRAEFMRFAKPNTFKKIQWKKLEEELYGEPIYKRIQRYKKIKQTARKF